VRRILLALTCVTLLFAAACSSDSGESTDDTTSTTAGGDKSDSTRTTKKDDGRQLANTPVCRALQAYLTEELVVAKAAEGDDQAAKDAAMVSLTADAAALKTLAGDLTIPIDVRTTALAKTITGTPLTPEEQTAAKGATDALGEFKKSTCRISQGLGLGGSTTTAAP